MLSPSVKIELLVMDQKSWLGFSFEDVPFYLGNTWDSFANIASTRVNRLQKNMTIVTTHLLRVTKSLSILPEVNFYFIDKKVIKPFSGDILI